MKKLLMVFVMMSFLTSVCLCETIPAAMVVQVRQSAVREYASVVAPVVFVLRFRDPVLFWGSKDGWAQVQLPGSSKIYYMFMSALAHRSGGQESVSDAASGVCSPEVVLAGKGFDSALEDAYAKNSHADYSWVNLMESWSCPPETLADFLACGE